MAYTIKVLGRNKKSFRSVEKQNNNKLFGMSIITPGRINSLIRGKGQPRINTRKEFVIKTQGHVQTRTTGKIYRTSMARTLRRHGERLTISLRK